jgi:hypothetical protein
LSDSKVIVTIAPGMFCQFPLSDIAALRFNAPPQNNPKQKNKEDIKLEVVWATQ